MNQSFRKSTILTLNGLSEKDIKYMIMEAMHHKDENMLASLGVLFEIVWK